MSCFEAPSLWHFFTAATGNWHSRSWSNGLFKEAHRSPSLSGPSVWCLQCGSLKGARILTWYMSQRKRELEENFLCFVCLFVFSHAMSLPAHSVHRKVSRSGPHVKRGELTSTFYSKALSKALLTYF